ncbi:unnamed protein product, partial [Closterium sp. NIES-54]
MPPFLPTQPFAADDHPVDLHSHACLPVPSFPTPPSARALPWQQRKGRFTTCSGRPMGRNLWWCMDPLHSQSCVCSPTPPDLFLSCPPFSCPHPAPAVMPAKATLFDNRCKPLFDFGSGPRNLVRWSPHSRFICLAGFGNLPGDV